jgi:hypothetical protein
MTKLAFKMISKWCVNVVKPFLLTHLGKVVTLKRSYKLIWQLFWIFGFMYTGFAVFTCFSHFRSYPAMISTKEKF